MAFLCVTFAAASQHAAAAEKILAFGDSLTAGYGLPEAQGFVPRLQAALQEMGHDVAVINGGVSGETSAGGLARIAWALQDKPTMMILELGANDMLRGIDPAATRSNLESIILAAGETGVPVMLAGMKAIANYGVEYQTTFDSIYPDLALRHNLVFMPFFLDGVATDPNLIQEDGLHPNAAGVQVMVNNALPYVLATLDRAKAAR